MRAKNRLGMNLGICAAACAAVFTAASLSAALPRASADTVPVGGNYFLSDYDSRAESKSAGAEISARIVREGTVLLKNDEVNGKKALPLDGKDRISIFGTAFHRNSDWGIYGAMTRAGFGLNTTLDNFLRDANASGAGAPGYPGNGTMLSGLNTGETPISMYTDAVKKSIEGTVGLVILNRTAGEGFDLPRTSYWDGNDFKKFATGNKELIPGARATDDHYFQLTRNETDMLKLACELCSKVVVYFHTPAPFESGFLFDSDCEAYNAKIGAAIWSPSLVYMEEAKDESGALIHGYNAIVDILSGKLNPSGHLTDTWARDFKADPTWNNFGNNFEEDGEDSVKGNRYSNLARESGKPGDGYRNNYVYYKEGIYSGYRYWETRGYTEGLTKQWKGTETDVLPHYAHGPNEAIHYYSKTGADKSKQDALDGKEWNNWYDAHVVYPLGYGLSYTDFTWTLEDITESLDISGKITAHVTVKNTGSVAGKDVVQLYYNPPYIDGEIEKAHVKLGAFAKTKLLQPNESETVTFEFDVSDMASYDYNDANKNGFKGYELDAGTYNIYIGENAHCWAECDGENLLKKSYTLESGIKYDGNTAKGKNVENRFDEMSEQLLHEDRYPEDEAKNEKDKYMSRADFAGTYPTLSYGLTASQRIIDSLNEQYSSREDKTTDPWYTDTAPTTGVKNDKAIKLKELFGLDYDDDKWENFLDQLTVAQLEELVTKGSYKAGIDCPELGITVASNQDSPHMMLFPDRGDSEKQLSLRFCPVIGLAATWNEELAYEQGKATGDLSLWGGLSTATRVPGWYAPAVNIHRNPFGGRVSEYYSEDALLTGKMAAANIRGAQSKGTWCYVKHFAVNNQETNRSGVMTWADEQTMREVYFPAFEICVKEGEPLGFMTALNRIGSTWAGGSYELLTGVLKTEWGFRGNIVTDSYSAGWGHVDNLIRAGGSLALGDAQLNVGKTGDTYSATTLNCLRESAHGVLYSLANSMAINEGDYPTVPSKIKSFTGETIRDIAMVNVRFEHSLKDRVILNTVDYPDLDAENLVFSVAEGYALPNGLTLSNDGVISGMPRTESKSAVKIVATYDDETATAEFKLNVIGESGAVIYDESTDINTRVGAEIFRAVNTAYIYDPYATEEERAKFPSVTYSLADGSLLPDGIMLTEDGYLIGKTEFECRDYRFTIVASALGYPAAECEFKLSALSAISLDGSAFTARYGEYFAEKITAAADDGTSVTYSLKEGSSLPRGMTFTSGGHLVGLPQEAGSFEFTVIADGGKYVDPVEATYTLKVDPKFDSATELPFGKVGEAYFGSVGTAQGSFGITYKLVGGALPEGLTLSEDGTVSGTPAAFGTYTLVIRAEDGDLSDEVMLDLFIDNAGSITTVIKGEKDVVKPAAVALGVTTGVFAAGFATMTALYVLGRKKSKK